MAQFKVTLHGTLPCTAYLEVQAESAEEAKELADVRYADANWDGADFEQPEGYTIEISDVVEI
jgi:ABC-type proline/glycine betaine transport system substrate-binding protein